MGGILGDCFALAALVLFRFGFVPNTPPHHLSRRFGVVSFPTIIVTPDATAALGYSQYSGATKLLPLRTFLNNHARVIHGETIDKPCTRVVAIRTK